MAQHSPIRAAAASLAIIAVAVLAVAAIVGHARRTSALMQFVEVPMQAPQLVRMPGSGYSGRATNEEDFADPYGGGDRPGPYGYVNDPYDGDWALGPLGGKAKNVQSLQALRGVAPMKAEDRNIWGAEPMGTNSIFMPPLSAKQAGLDKPQAPVRRAARPTQAQQVVQQHMSDDYVPTADWVGTNSVFFGSNGGGNGWARKDRKNLVHNTQTKMKAKLQSLFRSDDPHLAEYGLEGDNQLNDDVLPSAIGTGGPVIGVDGEPSNVDHAWVHYKDDFSYACNPDVYGCETGLTVDPEYAWD